MKRQKNRKHDEEARQLLANPLFLYRTSQIISDLGVVGEERNRLIVVLAGLTRTLDEPVSLLIKGSTSSGKSNLLRTSLRLFARDCVVERASLSAKAPAHMEESLGGRILFLQEYRGGKDAQLLIRLLQSEGNIAHEYTSVIGRDRRTIVAEQIGIPVVLTTTTDSQVFPDDETRFLSVYIDESAAQTLEIVRAQVCRPRPKITPPLRVWSRALALVKRIEKDFQTPPRWLTYVAEQLPAGNVRTRRDWKRFLSFCSAVALLRRTKDGIPVNITFADYAVAYKILEPALAATSHAVHPQELAVVRAVQTIAKHRHPVSVRGIAEHLGWKESRVYKWVRLAQDHHRIAVESETHERNQKFIVPNSDRTVGFLPRPESVFRHNKELGERASYINPLTGKRRVFRRD